MLLQKDLHQRESFVALFLKKEKIYCTEVEYVSMTENKGRKEGAAGRAIPEVYEIGMSSLQFPIWFKMKTS